MHNKLLGEGKNCWRIVHARSVSFLVDGAAYFSAFAKVLPTARHSIFILGWDIHSRIRLLREGEEAEFSELGPLLNKRLDECPELQVYILNWDFPWVITHEREIPNVRGGWFDHPRLHFEFDDKHPVGACHHQKIVVIDDTVAFAGGLDFANSRWDTPQHLASDPRRKNPDGKEGMPAHDIQVAVEGDAARALGEIARYRWHQKTGKSAVPILETRPTDGQLPAIESPDVTDVQIAISRTHPAYGEQSEIREVAALHHDAIASARHSIYIENQYLTSPEIVEAIGRRLQEPDGPEVVIVLPLKNFGWMEAHTIEVLRARSIHRLRTEFDLHKRLRVCYPVAPGLGEKWITVHGKVLIIDDNLLRVGSSNLTRRSMTIDTECDLSIEAAGDDRIRQAIADFRNRLLGEHLGMTPGSVSTLLERHHSLVQLVDDREGAARSLRRLELEGTTDAFVDDKIIDPAEPISAEVLLEEFSPLEPARKTRRRAVGILSLMAALIGLAALWKWTPLNQWIDAEFLAFQGDRLRELPMTPLLVVVVYVLAAVVVFPVLVLIFATALLFGPWLGMVYSLCGCLASALFTYWLGKVFGRSTVEKLAGGSGFQRLAQRLGDSGVLTIATLRLFPVAPFTIVNMVMGASGARLKNYALGTILGLLPGITAICLFQSRIEAVLRRPEAGNLIILALISALVVVAVVWLRRHPRVVRSSS
jgi:phospholipase D1/2